MESEIRDDIKVKIEDQLDMNKMDNQSIVYNSSFSKLSENANQNDSDVLNESLGMHLTVKTECNDTTLIPTSFESKKDDTNSSTLTKKQQKKLAKKRQWEECKQHRRAKNKIKKKELKARIKNGIVPPNYLTRKQKQNNLMKTSSCKVGVAIDMSFNDLMIEKDLAKCIKQIHRSYSINRKQENPMQYYVTSFGGKAKEMILKHAGWENWDVNFTDKSYIDLEDYPKENVVYLTSESSNVINELQPGYLYVIGGLVDHNSQKGLCHSLAVKNKVNHARLPILEHINMKTRQVLTIDHVFEILELVTHDSTWENALMTVIAPRKNAQPKKSESDSSS